MSDEPMPEVAAPDQATKEAPPDLYTTLWTTIQETGAFETWEQLIAVALKTEDIEKVRTVFEAFLAKHPLCYGYWQKYANAESKLGTPEQTQAILEQGVAATPYSVELWVHYVAWKRKQPECDDAAVRSLFQRAHTYIEHDWNSHKLWDKWIEFESSRDVAELAKVYNIVIALPIKELARYQQSFLEFVASNNLEDLISAEDLAQVTERARLAKAAQPPVVKELAVAENPTPTPEAGTAAETEGPTEDAPPGVTEMDAEETLAPVTVTPDEVKSHWIVEQTVRTEAALLKRSARQPFEKGIRRFWWHHKPLDAAQLLNWWSYLDFLHVDSPEITVMYAMFERCLVACASYPEFWRRFIKYLDSQDQSEMCQSALTRATQTFCPQRPDMLLFAAMLHESKSRIPEARALFEKLHGEVAPRSLEVVVRYANFERRQGNWDAAVKLYTTALAEEKSHGDSVMCTHLALQYASFLQTGKSREGLCAAEGAKTGCDEAAAVLDGCLTLFPERLELWQGAIAVAERSCCDAETSAAVLQMYRRALHQRSKVEGVAQDEGQQVVGEQPVAAEGALVFSLHEREMLAAQATAFADTGADAKALWTCEDMVMEQQRDILQAAEAASKKLADGTMGHERAAKRHASEAAVTHPHAVDPNAHTYAQQQHHHQQPAYDYHSAYYQQQQQGYYPSYAY